MPALAVAPVAAVVGEGSCLAEDIRLAAGIRLVVVADRRHRAVVVVVVGRRSLAAAGPEAEVGQTARCPLEPSHLGHKEE
jgi:hypothetical protein